MAKGRPKQQEKPPVAGAGSSSRTDLPASSNTPPARQSPPQDVGCGAGSSGSNQADDEQLSASTMTRQRCASSVARVTPETTSLGTTEAAVSFDATERGGTNNTDTSADFMMHVPSTPSNDDRNIRPGAYRVRGWS